MKSYSLGDRERRKYIVAFAGASVFIVNAFWHYFPTYTGISIPALQLGWGVTMGIVFSVIYLGFTKYMWRLSWVQSWTNVPDLNGVWMGIMDRESFVDESSEAGVPVTMTISQTFTHMEIKLENNLSPTSPLKTVSGTTSIDVSGNFTGGFTLNQGFEGKNGDGGTFFGQFVMKLSDKEGILALDGNYISSVPRRGQISLKRVHPKATLIKTKIRRLKSASGAEYLGVTVHQKETINMRRKLHKLVGKNRFSLLLDNRMSRDGSAYHITVVDPVEFTTLKPEQVESLDGMDGHFLLKSLGSVENDNSSAYYIIVESQFAAFLRSRAELPAKDFHLTLGFDPFDIHDLPKDDSTSLDHA